MTNGTRNYYTSSNYEGTIPTREEFHKFASNELSEADFCTNYPSTAGFQTNRVVNAIRWTHSNERKWNYNR